MSHHIRQVLQRSETRHLIVMLATASMALVIVALTLSPSPPTPPSLFSLSDKAYHAIAFAALVLPAAVLHTSSLAWVLPSGFALGALIELIQPSIGRSGEVLDLVANVVGLAAGVALGWILRSALRKRLIAQSQS